MEVQDMRKPPHRGWLAGINAALKTLGREQVVFGPSQSPILEY